MLEFTLIIELVDQAMDEPATVVSQVPKHLTNWSYLIYSAPEQKTSAIGSLHRRALRAQCVDRGDVCGEDYCVKDA